LGYYKINATDPRISMSKLIHNICRGCNGPYPKKTAPNRVITAATKFIVSCITRNFLTDWNVCLPHLIVVKIEEKLSFKKTISEASFAILLAVPFIDKLTSAFLRA